MSKREEIATILTDLMGYKPNVDDHPVTTIEKMLKEGRSGQVGYDSQQLGRCYWQYKAIVLGDAEMPMTNGGRAYANKDVQTPIGRLRQTTYRIDSGD